MSRSEQFGTLAPNVVSIPLEDDDTGPNPDLPQVASGLARWMVETPLGDASFGTHEAAERFVSDHGGTVVGYFHAMGNES